MNGSIINEYLISSQKIIFIKDVLIRGYISAKNRLSIRSYSKGEMPDQIYSVTWNGKEKVSYVYDGLGRLTTKNIGSFDTSYSYENVGEDKTTTLAKSVATLAETYTYTYDNIGDTFGFIYGAV